MLVGTLNVRPRPTFLATFNTIFGIGLLKAKRLESLLLARPFTKGEIDFYELLTSRVGYKILYSMPVERRLKLFIAKYLERQYLTYHYKTYRVLQGLGANGQRTKANARTPKRFNHYTHLNLGRACIEVGTPHYRKKELFLNERFNEYKVYAQTQIDDKAQKKEQKKLRAKQAREQYYKNQKNQKKR